jgi:hypothetical protein
MPGFAGHIKKENRIPTWHGGPHGPRYAPYPYNPNAKPAPGHKRHPDATSTASARSLGGQTPTNPMGGGMPGMGGGGNFGPAPPGKVRGQDGQLYDYRGPTDAQGSPDLSNLPRGGAGGRWMPGYGPGGKLSPQNPMGGGIPYGTGTPPPGHQYSRAGGAPAGGARGLSGGFGNLFNRLQSNAQSNAFNNYSRSLGNRRMF